MIQLQQYCNNCSPEALRTIQNKVRITLLLQINLCPAVSFHNKNSRHMERDPLTATGTSGYAAFPEKTGSQPCVMHYLSTILPSRRGSIRPFGCQRLHSFTGINPHSSVRTTPPDFASVSSPVRIREQINCCPSSL